MRKKKLAALLAITAMVAFGGCQYGNNIERQSGVTQGTATAETPVSEEAGEMGLQEQEKIVNNGGFFVKVDDKIYYRVFGENSFNTEVVSATFFLNGAEGHESNTIMCVAASDPAGEAQTVIENDSGYGPLYICGDYLYSGHVNEQYEETVYRTSLKTNEVEKIGDGFILGASPNGKILCVESYDFSNDFTVSVSFYEDGKQILSRNVASLAISSYFLGMDDQNAYFYLYDYTDGTSAITQLNRDGKFLVLAQLEPFYNDYSIGHQIADARVENDKISFTLKLLQSYVTDIREIVVPICTDPANTSDERILFEATVSENLYNEEYSGFGDYPEAIARLNRSDEETNGTVRAIQKVEEVDGKYYVIVANAVMNGRYDAEGWSNSLRLYHLLNLEYYYYSETDGLNLIGTYPCLDGRVKARAWLVGEDGKRVDSLLYQICEMDGMETEQASDLYFYNAEISEDVVYEHPEGDDPNGDRIEDVFDAFVDKLQGASPSPYILTVPEKNDYYGYDAPGNDDIDNYLLVHIGFDSEGRVNYIRPVTVD